MPEICIDSFLPKHEVEEILEMYLKRGDIEFNSQTMKYYLALKLWHFWQNQGFTEKIPKGERSIWLDKSPVKDWYPDHTQPQPALIYYIGPYKEPYLTIYKKLVKPTVESLGLKCTTALDDPGSEEFLRNKILPNLLNARFVICDLSEGNENVHYELGWLHAFGTPFLTYTSTSRPSDIRHLTINGYHMNRNGLGELQELIISSLEKNEIVTNRKTITLDFDRILEELDIPNNE